MRMEEHEYFEQRLDDQINWYDKKSGANQKAFKRLRLIEIVTAATIPLLAGFSQGSPEIPVAIGIAGMIVTIVAGVLALYRFQENWHEYRAASESLKQEKYLYIARALPYNGEQPFELLVQRVEALLSSETNHWADAMRAANSKAEMEVAGSADSTGAEKPVP